MIRKALIGIITNYVDNSNTFKPKMIAWLEKQRQEPKKVSIWKHWKDGIAGNGDGKQIYLIKVGNIYDISSCLGCECDYIELSELDKLTREEKQMEQKSVNKVIPKFKIGDFIVNDYCFGKVIEITNDAYLLDTGQGIPFSCEHNAHLWTIQDAKDGDILIGEDKRPFIYKGFLDKLHLYPVAYCGICNDDSFQVSTGDNWWTDEEVYPATKEQRDLLFQKMHEDRYEWDAEKKELKEIETPKECICTSPEEYNKAVNECWCRNKSRWSEEDEKNLLGIIDEIKANKSNAPDYDLETYDKFLCWLESLKQRML